MSNFFGLSFIFPNTNIKTMKYLTLILLYFFSLSMGYSQSTQQQAVLEKFLEMHWTGTEEAIAHFIKETYEPELYEKIKLEDHIKFYATIIEEFGPLNPKIYQVKEEKENSVVVHLVKENQLLITPQSSQLNPADILVVSLEMSEKHPSFLKRGLGLGSLLCMQKKEGK